MSDDTWHQADETGIPAADAPPPPDAESVSRASVDDPWAAFEPLYLEYHDRLYRIAVLLCAGRYADAEDAVAETFVKVHKAWADGRVEEFFPYARQSLVNHVMGRYRREQTARRHLVAASDPEATTRSFDETIVDTEVVLAALDQLPPRRRTAVVLRFFEDLPYQEIADEMGVALGTAKAQVSTGLDQLRELVGSSSGE